MITNSWNNTILDGLYHPVRQAPIKYPSGLLEQEKAKKLLKARKVLLNPYDNAQPPSHPFKLISPSNANGSYFQQAGTGRRRKRPTKVCSNLPKKSSTHLSTIDSYGIQANFPKAIKKGRGGKVKTLPVRLNRKSSWSVGKIEVKPEHHTFA